MDVPPGSGVLRFGEHALDLATGELGHPGDAAPTALGARLTRLLALLAWRHGQLVTRDDIQSYVWSDGTTVDFDQSINQHIRQLRQVLGDSAARPTWIQTLPARGYRFLAAATLTDATAACADTRAAAPSAPAALGLAALGALAPSSVEASAGAMAQSGPGASAVDAARAGLAAGGVLTPPSVEAAAMAQSSPGASAVDAARAGLAAGGVLTPPSVEAGAMARSGPGASAVDAAPAGLAAGGVLTPPSIEAGAMAQSSPGASAGDAAPAGLAAGGVLTPPSVDDPATGAVGSGPGGSVADAPRAVLEPRSRRPLLASRRRRIGAAALVGLAFASLLLTTSDSGSVATTRTLDPAAPVRLAVLPLDSEAADQDRAIAATEELIAALGEAYAPSLEVIALGSVMRYRGSTAPPSTIARELGVDFVLEGRVRTQLDRARVTLGLVRGRDSAHVWVRTFEQSQHTWTTEAVMAQDVAAALGGVLLPHRARPDIALDIDAQQDMLRGRYLLRRAPRAAAQAFAAVTVRVPRSAKAWAALGLAELRTSYRRFGAAASAADKALAIDPAQPEGHFVRAVTAFYGEWRPEGARQHLMAAIAANPAFAEAHHTLAAAYSAAGRHDEAIAAMQRAFALDPLDPEVVSDVGWYYYFARRYGEAAVWCRRTLAIDAHFYWAHRCIVMSRMRQGDSAAALAAALEDLRARGAPAAVIDAIPTRGLAAYWTWERDRIEPDGANGDSCDRAAADLALGDTARALDDLEQGVHGRHDWLLPFLAVDPTFDPLRGQPRFDAVLRTVAAGTSL